MFETIRLVLQLLPLIISVTKQLEELFPDSGLGKMKMSLVIETVRASLGASQDLVPTITKVVDVVVMVFNNFGVFKKA
jgi:hypothetical protein